MASSKPADSIGGGWPNRCSYFAQSLSSVASCNKVIVITPFGCPLRNDADSLDGRNVTTALRTPCLCAFGTPNNPVFWVIQSEEPASPRHWAFTAGDREMVTHFYHAGLQKGGEEHGPPGLRPQYHEHYYGAFLLDPDGNNVEAVCHMPEEPE